MHEAKLHTEVNAHCATQKETMLALDFTTRRRALDIETKNFIICTKPHESFMCGVKKSCVREGVGRGFNKAALALLFYALLAPRINFNYWRTRARGSGAASTLIIIYHKEWLVRSENKQLSAYYFSSRRERRRCYALCRSGGLGAAFQRETNKNSSSLHNAEARQHN